MFKKKEEGKYYVQYRFFLVALVLTAAFRKRMGKEELNRLKKCMVRNKLSRL